MAFRDDLKKYRESQSKKTTTSTTTKTTQASTSGSSGSGSSGSSFRDWLKEYREVAPTISLQGWTETSSNLINDVRLKSSDWYDDTEEQTRSERFTKLLSLADSWRKQYAGNQEAVSHIDSVVSALSEAKTYSFNNRQYFSQWKTQGDYKKYLQEQKDYEGLVNFDLDAGEKEVKALEALRDEYDRLVVRQSTADPNSEANVRLRELRSQYGSKEDIEKLLSEKNAYINRAKHIQEGITLAGVVDSADFDANNDYVSTKSDNWWRKLTSDYGMGYEDLTYEYINGADNGIRDEIKQKKRVFSSDSGDGESTFEEKGYDYLEEDEIAIYNYYYSKDGKEAAEKYLDSIQETLNHRKATSMYKNMEDKTLLELAFGVAAGLDQFESGTKNLFNTKDDYIPTTATQMASGMVREDLADEGPKLPEWLGGSSLGQVGYDAITTTANMAPSMLSSMAMNILVPGSGAIVGNTMMFASSAGNAYQEALNLGYDKSQARAYSTLVGASEAGLQYLLGGISSLGGTASSAALTKMLDGIDNAFARTALKLGGNMLSEGFEEGLQEVLTPLFKNWALRVDEDINWSEVAYSGLLGALTAGIMEGGSTISGEVNTYKTGKQLQAADISAQRLAEIGKTFSADTVAYQLAGRVNENTGAYTLGRLFNEIGATLSEQNVTEITNALVAKGMDEKTAKKNAEVLAYVVEGGQLSDRDIAKVEANEVLAEVARTTLIDANTTWNQRSKGYNEMLKALADEVTSRTKAAKQSGENTPTSDTVDAKNENGTENLSEADTVDTSPAKVQSISSIKNGQATVKLEDGSEVDVKKADLDPDEGVRIENIASIEGISAADANFILNTLRTSTNASAQMDSLGAKEAYKYGFYGFSQEHMTTHGVFANSLTDAQRQAIYDLGKNARQQQIEKATPKKGTGINKETGIYFDNGNGDVVTFRDAKKTLTEKQTAGVQAAMILRKLGIGGDIYFFESYRNDKGQLVYKDKNGKEAKAPNGWYSPGDGSIHIDLNAGNGGKGFVLFTLAHELTHFIEQWSPQKYKILADFLVENYEKGQSMDKLVRAKQEKLSANRGKKVSYKEAYSEVVADSMEAMLADGNVMDKLLELKAKDNSLFMKMKQFFDNLLKKLRSIYKDQTPDSAEGRAVLEMTDSIEKIQQLFADALVDASENFQAAEKNTTQEGGVKMQTRSVNGNDVVWIEENILKENKDLPVHQFIANYISEHIGEVYTIIESGQKVYIGEDLPGEYTQSKYTKAILKNNPNIARAKNRAPANLGEMIEIATNRRWEKTKHPGSKDAKYGMYRYDTSFGFPVKNASGNVVGANIYDAELLIRNASDGKKYLYDIVSIKKNTAASNWLTQRVTSAAGKPAGQKSDVSDNKVTQKSDDVKSKSVEEIGLVADEKTESVAPGEQFSERTWTESDYVQEREKAAKEIAKAIGVSEKKAKAYIDSVNSIAKMIAEDRVRLDYFSSPGRSSFVGNVEYGGSFDFSTLCKKRRLLTGTFTAIQKALPNTALTANEILDIRNRMKKAGLEVSCGLCYVEGSRANMGQFAQEFLKLYKQYYPDAWQPNMADVNTPEGIEWVRINHPEAYEQYEYFWNHYGTLKAGDKNLFASQQKPKLYQLHTEYKGEILEKFNDDDNVEDKNLNGGIRLQSFSDFEIVHLIDTMQIIMDMSRVGLAGQAYTKVPDFAWALGDTGLKINLSLIAKGVDENGKLIFDDVEGMPIETAVALRNRYSKNVGTILVAFNDEQLMAAMADERVDFIIPFHRSQWKKSQYEAMGLPAKTKDYTYMQNEKFIKPQYHEYRGRMVKDKATNYMPNEYWDFSKSGKENAEAYLEMCARNNKRPKFYKLLKNNGNGSYSLKADGSTDGYWKLLIDFKMYDNDGVGSPQMPVKPDFNMEEAQRMLDTYQGGHSNFPVAQGIVDSFVSEYKESHGDIQYSERDNVPTFYSQMAKVVDELKQEKHGAASVIDTLRNKGVKAEEIKWSGIEAFLEGKKSVTKAELQEFIAGSMLQIEEEVLDNKDRPYTEDQQKRLDEYEAKRDEVAKRLASEWKKITGEEFPVRNPGAGLESVVVNKIIDANKEHKGAAFEGRLLAKLKKDLKVVIENNDDFGFDSWRDAIRAIHRHRRDFIKNYEMSTNDKAIIVKYCNALNAYNELPNFISEADTDRLRAIARETDPWTRRIMEVKHEHNEEEAKYMTNWDQYKIEGGKNYREMLFRIPGSTYSNSAMFGHWKDRAGVLAHARVQDMDTFIGKMLFVEEIQSDWHNEGHKEGYRKENEKTDLMLRRESQEAYKEFYTTVENMLESNANWEDDNAIYYAHPAVVAEMFDGNESHFNEYGFTEEQRETIRSMVAEEAARQEALKTAPKHDTAPDAPFKDNYHEYVLKRLLRIAAEEGYDSIGWTTAATQMDRWNPNRKTNAELGLTDAKNPDAVAFEKGYQIEYDQDIRKFMKRFGDKWGTKVGKTVLDNGTEVWSMAITDEMKDSVLTEGQPLYQDRADDSISNRSLLANAFESVAQNDIERQKIREYKGKIDLINAEEQKLSELNEKIKDLSFSKGPKDTKAIRDLQFEARQTANRINVYDKQLLRLEASKPLQDVLTREKKMAYKRAEQKGKEALEAYREKTMKTQRELLEKWQTSRKKGIDSRHRTAMRHKIKDVVNELNQYLLRGTKDRHVPIELQKAVAEALDAVNMDTVGAEERIAKLQAELMKAKTPEQIQEISKKIAHIQEMGDKMNGKLKKLKEAYDQFVNSDDPLIANSHDDVISNKLQSVIEAVGDTPLRDMTLSQLEDVYDMYRMVLTTIRNANKAFKAKKSESISTIANRVMMEVEKVGGKKKLTMKGMDGIKSFGWNNLKPVYAFEHIGSDAFTEVFNNVRDGEDVWAVDVTEAKEFYLDKSKKHNYDFWDFSKRYKFTSTSGMDFELSLEQIMSLYAYSKRDQAADHLKKGGIVIDETTEITVKNKLGIPVKFNPTEATAYNISDETLADIISKLTGEQKGFVDEMQDYLSTVMGEKGNEVSLEMYGVKLFKEKFYFPLKSAQQFMAKAKEQQQGEVKIKNSGFSKETVQKASNPIVLTPFMNVWANHVNEMSMYHAFVLPMEDFYRVYNYKTPTSDTMATESVEMFLQNAYGKGATKYIDQLLKDLNGGARTDSTTGIINKMMGLFKKGAVFASMSVVVQQPSAIARAAALVDTKYFIGPKVDHKRHKDLWNEVKQYAPVAIIKEMGYFDTNMGKSTQDFILGKEYSNFKDKMNALFTDSGYRDEVLSKAPALADEIAWCGIWEAVKRETKAKNPSMDTQSEAFLKKVGERFTEVIVKTQVYDSVLSRSALMRSKDTGMKMATAFMAEPTTSINMIADALLQGKRGNRKYARAAIGAVIASQILNSILVSFVYAGRDDDEDETYVEKYIGTLTGEVLDSLNPAGYIPFIKDIMSVVQGYDVERSDMAVISDLWKAWENLSKDTVSTYRKVEGFAGSIAQIFGLPVKNIMRDARSIYNTIDSFVNGAATTKTGIGYAVKSALPKWIGGGDVSNQEQLYEAYMSGDKTQIARVEGRYKDRDAINSAMRTAIKEHLLAGDIDDNTAVKYMVELCGDDENEAFWKVEEWKYKKQFEEDFGKYNEFYGAVQSGKDLKVIIKKYTDNGVSVETLKSQITSYFKPQYIEMSNSEKAGIKGYLLNAMTLLGDPREKAEERISQWEFEGEYGFTYDERKQQFLEGKLSASEMKSIIMDVEGKTEEEANSRIVTYTRDAYEEGYFDRSTATSAMVTYGGLTREEAESKLRYIDVKKQFPDTYVDDAWVDEYYSEVESSGISIEVFVDYRNKVKGITGKGKKEGRMEVIDSMPISDAQKDALYYAEGWAASKLYEAPWH